MFNNCKNLLKPCQTLKIHQHLTKTMADKVAASFEAKIDTLEDYIALIREKVEVDERVDSSILQRNFRQIDEAARKKVWDALFTSDTPLSEQQVNELSAFLREIKENVAFHSPWEYNEWIVKVRDELLKRNMLDFWRNVIVEHELGPCTCWESDLIEKSSSSDPGAFYRCDGCTTTDDVKKVTKKFSFDKTPADDDDEDDIELPTVNNIEDYSKLMAVFTAPEQDMDDEDLQESYEKVATATHETIWNALFGKPTPTADDLKLAADMLEKHRPDAAFFAPWDYNTWIVSVRDELLKRGMVEFWRDVIVAKELGLLWAKDSDFFDDMEDTAPAKFYEHAGCKAPFANES